MSEYNKPRVAVCMITYNHEKYIAEAIESIVRQKGDFDLVLYIGEDFSTDSTPAICKMYANRYPNSVKVLSYSQNQGVQKNFFSTLEACRSNADFVAFCDGDDFWTDDNKIQKQLDVLIGSPEYIGCFHNWNTVTEDGTEINPAYRIKTSKTVFTIRDAFAGWFVHINAILLRSSALPNKMPAYMYRTPVTDVCFYITVLTQGNFYYINETMCSYRMHGKGISVEMNRGNNMYLLRLKYFNMINKYYKYKYDFLIRNQIVYDSDILLKKLKIHSFADALLLGRAKFNKYIYSHTPTLIEKAWKKIA